MMELHFFNERSLRLDPLQAALELEPRLGEPMRQLLERGYGEEFEECYQRHFSHAERVEDAWPQRLLPPRRFVRRWFMRAMLDVQRAHPEYDWLGF